MFHALFGGLLVHIYIRTYLLLSNAKVTGHPVCLFSEAATWLGRDLSGCPQDCISRTRSSAHGRQ